MTFALGCIVVLGLLALAQAVCTRADARKFPAPGRLIDTAESRLHVVKTGTGEPAVVLEAGISATCLTWSVVQPQLAAIATTYSYDRAGLGWSAVDHRACSLDTMAEDLHRLLIQLEVPVPYILVAHSFGAYILLSYAQRFSSEIAGLVLVDPLTPEEWINPTRAQRRRLRRAAWLSRVGGVLAAVGLVRMCLWLFRTDHEHIPTHVRFARRVTRTGKRILGEITKLPTNVRRVIRVHWSRPRLFRVLANQIQALPKCAAEIARHPFPSQIPVTVISGIHQPAERLAEQAAMANRSLHGKHIMAGKSAHWIHFDEPELVVDAVREIAEKISPLISANGR